MASAQDVQSLLRFLSQDAKVPLAQAMGKVKGLQTAKLLTATDIAKAEFDSLKALFGDEKLARQVLNAAKRHERVSNKRPLTDVSPPSSTASPAKKPKLSFGLISDPATYEASLSLPEVNLDEDELKKIVVYTNRTPLLLAFAVALLNHTMPEQPLSSRLSLAQAVCSANSQGKAKAIGLQHGKTAEEMGWGEGQPEITVMGRKIKVMKRWGYEWREPDSPKSLNFTQQSPKSPTFTQQTFVDAEATQQQDFGPGFFKVSHDASDTQATFTIEEEPALWGVDLEALKNSNGPLTIGDQKTSTAGLPIYKPEGTRSYLLRSFESKSDGKKATGKKAIAEKERNLGMLLRALDLLYESWACVLSYDELDNKAWSWYINVRPDVKAGAAGWGGKGDIALADVLNLRRPAGYRQSSIST